MSKRFYRFRSLDSLLEKYKELESQTIYFASPTELNDPMEGFKNLVFNGDKIVWRNFFKHYLLCLEHVSSLYILCGEEHHNITEDSIPIFNGFDEFPTPMYKELFQKIYNETFLLCESFIDKISTRRTSIRKDEIGLYLTMFHSIAVEVIEKNYAQKQFIEQRKTSYHLDNTGFKKLEEMIDVIEKAIIETEDESIVSTLFLIQKQMQDEFHLISNLQSNLLVKSPNRNFLLIDFIDNYLNKIENLMYPEWYTACFMTESHNSSVWGHYGDEHEGVCLIFETNENNKISFDKNTTGLEFKPVEYNEEFIEIDFFKSIGSLPQKKLIDTWYIDDKKTISDIADSLINDHKKWHKNHWYNFDKVVLTKTKDWEYEKEYRLILSSILEQKIDKKDRVYKYDFNNLKGLIFGIKTPLEKKLEIIEIIKSKCELKNREDFEFYQAYYCHINKNIQHRKMSFLKFKKD